MSDDLLTLRYIPLSQAMTWETNPKLHDMGGIMTSIRRYGFKDPPKFEPHLNDGRGGIVEGNGRTAVLNLMRQDGMTTPRGIALLEDGQWAVPILFGVDAESQQAAEAYGIDHNSLTMMGGDFSAQDIMRLYKPEVYLTVLAGLAGDDELPVSVPAEDIGALLAAYDRLESDHTEHTTTTDADDPDLSVSSLEALVEKWNVRPGGLWSLGSHRLGCGDAADPHFVGRLLYGMKTPFLMTTDPPYGTNYDPTWRKGVHPHQEDAARPVRVKNDERTPDWADAYRFFPGNVAYVWHAALYAGLFQSGLLAAGFICRNQIIWRKNHFAVSQGHYHWQHEPCWYAVRKGQSANWRGERNQTTIWDIPNLHHAPKTPDDAKTPLSAQKPVECMLRPIRNHTQPGDAVYDPFAGSGTTLIAAELSDRIAIAGDLNPQMVAVSLERFSIRFPNLQILLLDNC